MSLLVEIIVGTSTLWPGTSLVHKSPPADSMNSSGLGYNIVYHQALFQLQYDNIRYH
jgi:hypothetical protein